ncbi:MAG: restriction endonuclease subunit S [Candidatus Anammoxibacter sp.]
MGKANIITKPIISFVNYSEIVNWSVRYILKNSFGYNKKYNLFQINDFLEKNTNVITVKDNVIYSRVTIKLYNKGVQKRDTIKGQYIGTKKQYLVKPEQFIISKIDARNGAFGIIPECLDGAIITSDFLSYDIDTAKINPGFLNLLTSTKQFLAYCQGASSGTTGRQRINEKSFLNVKIPLLPLEAQNRIVTAYNKKIELAERQEQQAKQLENDIESYLFDVLGIETLKEKKSKKGLQFVSFKNLKRWDTDFFLHKNSTISSKYDVINYGSLFKSLKNGIAERNFSDNGIRYLKVSDIKDNSISDRKIFRINKYKESDLILKNTLLITRKGTVGQSFFVNKQIEIVASSEIFIIHLNGKVLGQYLSEINLSSFVKNQYRKKSTGTIMPSLSQDKLREIKIPLPPLKLQNEIVNTINKMKAKIKTLQLQADENRKLAIEEFEKEIFQ